MINGKKIVVIIPARAGSKGVKGKNIRPVCGKPLIVYSIEAALNCRYVDEAYVSTDGDMIADVSLKAGAGVIRRPPELASDTSKSEDAIVHAVQYLEKESKVFDYVILLQPTSPLRTAEHLTQAIEQFEKEKKDSLISIRETEHSPYKCLYRTESGDIKPLFEDKLFGPRQLLPKTFRDAGAIYIVKKDFFMKTNCFYYSGCSVFTVPPSVAVDLDSELDFILVEAILNQTKK